MEKNTCWRNKTVQYLPSTLLVNFSFNSSFETEKRNQAQVYIKVNLTENLFKITPP